MVLVHVTLAPDGAPLFHAERVLADDSAGSPLAGEELLAVLQPLVARPGEMVLVAGNHVSLGGVNALTFFSTIRNRAYPKGVFLAPEVLDRVDEFHLAARLAATGNVLPVLEEKGNTFRAVWRPRQKGSPFFTYCVDQLMRHAGRTPLEMGGRADTAEDAFMAALRADDPTLVWGRAPVDESVTQRRQAECADLAQRIRAWYRPLAVSALDRANLAFHLIPPTVADGAWRVAYTPPVTRAGYVALGQAIRLFPPLGAAEFRREDAEAFLRTGVHTLLAAGFSADVPPGILGEHITAEADLTMPETPPARVAAATKPVQTKLVIRVAGQVVTEAEIKFLLDQNSPIVFFREHWIEVDRSILKEALRALQQTRGYTLSVHAAVAFLVGTHRVGALKITEARVHGWLRGLVNELKGGEGFRVLPPPEGLCGTLRDYQLRGYSWLSFLARWGFGACLADDMGLGKTVQLVAWAVAARRANPASGPLLVVAPVSVTTNWAREFAKFAPRLKVILHQGPNRLAGTSLAVACRRTDVVITGYSLLVHDFRALRAIAFSALALDEAQTIKNPDTQVAKAARALNIPVRFALTGTPLENTAADLWSIEEFLNPGLLGTRRDFTDTFGRDLTRGSDPTTAAAAARKLRHVLEPFMLRRLKSDPGVAAELGDKREVREYCPLMPDQRRAYEEALARFRDAAHDPNAGPRTGRVLGLLTELKQICDGAGKLQRLEGLLTDIFASGESALIFTQYVRVAKVIREHLVETYGKRFPFLHGGLSPAQREREIADFNADRAPNVFLISLKAGGFGLNLTRATHVIHFDRWWNPAVENQATDRAHRIGQSHTVFVHLFISSGTLEDRIDALLEDKRRLAGDIIGSGEAFLTQMSEREFERTVALDEP